MSGDKQNQFPIFEVHVSHYTGDSWMGIVFDPTFYPQVVASLLQSFKVGNDAADAEY